jgi:hypothetical protein
MGLFDLSNAFNFPELVSSLDFPTVADTALYAVPTGEEGGIISVADLTNKRNLLRLGLSEMQILDKEKRGRPIRWTRRGTNIEISPIPDGVYTISVIFRSAHDVLAAEADTTILPRTWDQAIVLAATAIGMNAIDNQAGFDKYNARYLDYLRSRDPDRDQTSPSEGVNVARSYDDLTRMR